MKEKKLVSVKEYAKLCEITEMGVHQRIKSGAIIFAEKKPINLIDIDEFPPIKRIPAGRKPYKSAFLS